MGTTYDMWEQRLARFFIPYEYVTVDETLVSFRGRCSFKQYMPSKPAKYGLKFWCLCDALTGYCLRMRPYLGTDNGEARAVGLGQQVVLDLTKNLDVGRTVVTDNFFTSLSLAQQLRQRQLALLGTIRKNRREIPDVLAKGKCQPLTSQFVFHKDATLVMFAPKKNKRVLLLSTEHSLPTVDSISKKPTAILTYNKSKGGVDHLDQMCAGYNSRKRTCRWPKCVFQHMIDVSAYNAFVLWKNVTGKENMKRREFLIALGTELCKNKVNEGGDVLLPGPTCVPQESTSLRPRCSLCVIRKTHKNCQKCGKPLCINCASYRCPHC